MNGLCRKRFGSCSHSTESSVVHAIDELPQCENSERVVLGGIGRLDGQKTTQSEKDATTREVIAAVKPDSHDIQVKYVFQIGVEAFGALIAFFVPARYEERDEPEGSGDLDIIPEILHQVSIDYGLHVCIESLPVDLVQPLGLFEVQGHGQVGDGAIDHQVHQAWLIPYFIQGFMENVTKHVSGGKLMVAIPKTDPENCKVGREAGNSVQICERGRQPMGQSVR